jgi:cysteine desulfuration protein SufE
MNAAVALFPMEPTAAEAQAAITEEFAFFSDWSER